MQNETNQEVDALAKSHLQDGEFVVVWVQFFTPLFFGAPGFGFVLEGFEFDFDAAPDQDCYP